MPTDPKAFQKSRLPWSRWKHAILINYLSTMAAILQSAGTIYYVDGFAGPGKYLEDGTKGSPLLAAEHARELSKTNENYSLRCINVESDGTVFPNLQNATSGFESLIENIHSNFGDSVEFILGKISEKPTLFFLDPIGLKGLEWNKLLPIYRRKAITELLVRFDAKTALRLTGSDHNLHKTFNAIVGEGISYWNNYYADCGDSGQEKRECITQAYEDKLRKHFDYVARMPITRSDDQLQYYLLFATRNLKGVQAMNDVFYRIQDLRDRTLDEERRSQQRLKQLSMFEPHPEDRLLDELNNLKELILQVMQIGQEYRRDDLRAKVALVKDNFGRFSGTHFTATLGGNPRKIQVPKEFKNLKSQITILNQSTLGTDKVKISLSKLGLE